MDFETRQETMKNLLTCGICRKLSREVTVIEECCHTFCWKCISEKITRGKCRNCPQCNADLGGAPIQRIKTDYKWQSIRDKFNNMRKQLIDYGLMKPREKGLNRASHDQARNGAEPNSDSKGKGKEHEASLDQALEEQVAEVGEEDGEEFEVSGGVPEMEPREIKGKDKLVPEPDNEESHFSVPLPFPTRRKKRSITSLVDASGASNRTSAPRTTRGRRNSIARKVLPPRKRRAYFTVVDNSDTDEDYIPSSMVRASISSKAQTEEQDLHAPEPLNQQTPQDNEAEPMELEPVDDLADGRRLSKSQPGNYKVVKEGESNGKEPTSVPSDSRKRRRGRRKKEEKKVLDDHHQDLNHSDPTEKRMLVEDLNIPTRVVVDPATVYRSAPPIWFQLVASNRKENCGTLPSLPPCYIQVKDVNMTASFIKKYLVVKLGLGSEDELEISMRGEPVHPDTQLHQLMELWVQTGKRSEWKKKAAAGGSGKEFVMVFAYSWSSGGNQF